MLGHLTFEEVPFILMVAGLSFAAGAVGYALRAFTRR